MFLYHNFCLPRSLYVIYSECSTNDFTHTIPLRGSCFGISHRTRPKPWTSLERALLFKDDTFYATLFVIIYLGVIFGTQEHIILGRPRIKEQFYINILFVDDLAAKIRTLRVWQIALSS